MRDFASCPFSPHPTDSRYRQQIEDLESSVKRMKEMLKKKEETERKYQGEGVVWGEVR